MLCRIDVEVGRKRCGNVNGLVAALGWDVKQGQACRLKDLIDESITFLTVLATMALVIQFERDPRLHCGRITQHEVDMLAVDLVGVDPEATRVAVLDPEKIVQADFSA